MNWFRKIFGKSKEEKIQCYLVWNDDALDFENDINRKLASLREHENSEVIDIQYDTTGTEWSVLIFYKFKDK